MTYFFMTHGSSYPVRRHPHLRHYDYATSGMYFVTVCIRDRLPLLGTVVDGQVQCTPAGEMVKELWIALPDHYPDVGIDAFVVMPNHVHGIVVLEEPKAGSSDDPARPRLSLSDVMHRWKSLTTARYRVGVKEQGWPRFAKTLWQQSFYEHVIRSDAELDRLRRYTVENPQQWELDQENLERRQR